MDRVTVAKGSDLKGADTTGGISRRTAIDEPELWAGISRIPAAVATGWHHHGTNTTVFYMMAGTLTVEHGANESAVATAGDFVVVPAGVEHREIIGSGVDAEAIVMRFGDGTGPLVIDVDRGEGDA